MNKQLFCRRAKIVLAVLMLALALPALALADVSMDAQIGYEGIVLNGHAVPLRVTLTNDGAALHAVVSVDVWQDTWEYDRLELPVALDENQTQQVILDVCSGLPQDIYTVQLRDEDGMLIAQTSVSPDERIGIDNNALIVGVLGTSAELPSAFSSASSEKNMRSVHLDAETFMHNAQEAEGIDVLAMDDFDAGVLSEAQQETLRTWIAEGGILILGTGTEKVNSIEWFSGMTGITVLNAQTPQSAQADEGKQETEPEPLMADVSSALMHYAGLSDDGAQAEQAAAPLSGGTPLCIQDGHMLMASAAYGNGQIIVCGVSLSGEGLLNAAQQSALWQRVLEKAAPSAYRAAVNVRGNNGYYPIELLTEMIVPSGSGLFVSAWLLAAYVLIVGVGLYGVFKRRDQSAKLWLAMPLTAIFVGVLLCVLSAAQDMNSPAAASMRVTHIDTENTMTTKEQVCLTYAGQMRRTVTGENQQMITRNQVSYFNDWYEPDAQMTLRDCITLGEEPAISLPEKATWITRQVAVDSERTLEGGVEATAYVAADGLHAQVTNGLHEKLIGAVLITDLGYANVGDIAPGETAEVFLKRSDSTQYDENGNDLILPDMACLYPQSLYTVANACVYPERVAAAWAGEEFDDLGLGTEEWARRSMRYTTLTLNAENPAWKLIATLEHSGCTQLLLDGQPITRNAQVGIVIKDVEMQLEAPDGHVYYPQTLFPAYSAVQSKDGTLRMDALITDSFISMKNMQGFSYDLSGVICETVETIRIYNPYGNQNDGSIMNLQAYDYVAKDWVTLENVSYTSVPEASAQRLISEEHQLFLRYESSDYNHYGYYVPSIVVEGRN